MWYLLYSIFLCQDGKRGLQVLHKIHFETQVTTKLQYLSDEIHYGATTCGNVVKSVVIMTTTKRHTTNFFVMSFHLVIMAPNSRRFNLTIHEHLGYVQDPGYHVLTLNIRARYM